MDVDLDLLLISVYCTADDLLPARRRNARRRLTDAEVVTLCVAQVVMGLPSDRRFLRAARRQLGHLFPKLPSQSALHKRRARLGEAIEWLIGVFASASPGFFDDSATRRRFKAALAAAGIRQMRFHDLRHTFGTLAVQVWPLSDVQAYMGHADISTTMIYVHHVPQVDAADRLSALVASASGPAGSPESRREALAVGGR